MTHLTACSSKLETNYKLHDGAGELWKHVLASIIQVVALVLPYRHCILISLLPQPLARRSLECGDAKESLSVSHMSSFQ